MSMRSKGPAGPRTGSFMVLKGGNTLSYSPEQVVAP
jgi:hypothetical protein